MAANADISSLRGCDSSASYNGESCVLTHDYGCETLVRHQLTAVRSAKPCHSRVVRAVVFIDVIAVVAAFSDDLMRCAFGLGRSEVSTSPYPSHNFLFLFFYCRSDFYSKLPNFLT